MARWRELTRWFVCFSLCAGAVASAQEQPRPEALYVHTPLFLGTPRAVGMGGAFVAVAEGASYTSTHASFANPPRDASKNFDFDFTLETAEPLFGAVTDQDLQNDGVADGVTTLQFLMGAQLRYRAVGVGAYLRSTGLFYCLNAACGAGPDEVLTVSLASWGVSAAVAFWDEQIVTALGAHGVAAGFGTDSEQRGYNGGGPGVDVLWRPRGLPFRVGATYRPGIVAALVADPSKPFTVAGRRVFTAAASPHVFSLGASVRVGEFAATFNERRVQPQTADEGFIASTFGNRHEPVPGALLLSVQVDLTTPVQNAVSSDAFVANGSLPSVGTQFAVAPRVGVEHLTWPGRLRLRAGGWLEPSPITGRGPRPHVTAGFELFLFHLLLDWGVVAAVDVAPGYNQGTVSFGTWH